MEEAKLPEPQYQLDTGGGWLAPTKGFTADQMLAYGRECARIAVEAERERRAEAALSFVGAAGPFGDPEVVNLAGTLGVPEAPVPAGWRWKYGDTEHHKWVVSDQPPPPMVKVFFLEALRPVDVKASDPQP